MRNFRYFFFSLDLEIFYLFVVSVDVADDYQMIVYRFLVK